MVYQPQHHAQCAVHHRRQQSPPRRVRVAVWHGRDGDHGAAAGQPLPAPDPQSGGSGNTAQLQPFQRECRARTVVAGTDLRLLATTRRTGHHRGPGRAAPRRAGQPPTGGRYPSLTASPPRARRCGVWNNQNRRRTRPSTRRWTSCNGSWAPPNSGWISRCYLVEAPGVLLGGTDCPGCDERGNQSGSVRASRQSRGRRASPAASHWSAALNATW